MPALMIAISKTDRAIQRLGLPTPVRVSAGAVIDGVCVAALAGGVLLHYRHVRNKAIARGGHGLDISGDVAVLVQRLAQQSDCAGQGVLRHHGVRPHRIQQLLFTHQPIPVFDQIEEQPERLRFDLHWRSVFRETEFPIVDFKSIEPINHSVSPV